MAKRIRIYFINCPRLAVEATSFLILSQNTVQTTLQFEVHHFWQFESIKNGPLKGLWNKFLSLCEDDFHRVFAWRERWYRRNLDIRGAPVFSQTLGFNEWRGPIKDVIDKYDTWLQGSGYSKYDFHPTDPAIIITETPLYGKYLSYANEKTGVGVLCAADWRAFMGSGSASALEYLLTGVQRVSLRLCYGAVIGSHYSTRGCLWDFNNHQPDVKMSTFLGYLCEVCRAGLKKATTPEEFEEISRLIKNDWVGEESTPSSIAGILKKDYGYALNRSTGLRPSLMTGVSDSMKSEIGKFVVEVIKWILIVLVSLIVLTYFPSVADKWKDFINAKSTAESPSK